MSYTWTNGEVITAEKLNNTGGGVFVVPITIDTSDESYTTTALFADAKAAMENGSAILFTFLPVRVNISGSEFRTTSMTLIASYLMQESHDEILGEVFVAVDPDSNVFAFKDDNTIEYREGAN